VERTRELLASVDETEVGKSLTSVPEVTRNDRKNVPALASRPIASFLKQALPLSTELTSEFLCPLQDRWQHRLGRHRPIRLANDDAILDDIGAIPPRGWGAYSEKPLGARASDSALAQKRFELSIARQESNRRWLIRYPLRLTQPVHYVQEPLGGMKIMVGLVNCDTWPLPRFVGWPGEGRLVFKRINPVRVPAKHRSPSLFRPRQ
jgi:hypothetical protein